MNTIVCIGTGPSLTLEQIAAARRKKFRLFGCNVAFRACPDLELLFATNENTWDYIWPEVRDKSFHKWTTNLPAAQRYGIHWIAEQYGEGLCETPGLIHHGHGAGFSLLSMAHKAGASRVILLGYDLRYAEDYDGYAQRIGSTPRHSRLLLPDGEYPNALQHWPKVAVKNGVHFEMIRLYETVREQGLVEVLNGSSDSPFDVFPKVNIEDL